MCLSFRKALKSYKLTETNEIEVRVVRLFVPLFDVGKAGVDGFTHFLESIGDDHVLPGSLQHLKERQSTLHGGVLGTRE